MKIQAIVIAAALACAGAFAAAPNDTAKAPNTDTATATTASTSLDKAPVKHAGKRHHRRAAHHAKRMHRDHYVARHGKRMHHMGAGPASQVDVNDAGREARMDAALANFRRNRS